MLLGLKNKDALQKIPKQGPTKAECINALVRGFLSVAGYVEDIQAVTRARYQELREVRSRISPTCEMIETSLEMVIDEFDELGCSWGLDENGYFYARVLNLVQHMLMGNSCEIFQGVREEQQREALA